MREAARIVKLPESTYAEIEKGKGMSSKTLAAIMRWIFEEPASQGATRLR